MDTIIINESESIIRNIPDLIVGASLVLGGLVANEQTDVSNIYHAEIRYEKLEDILRDLGGNVKKFNN